jgi:hypothetical protein
LQGLPALAARDGVWGSGGAGSADGASAGDASGELAALRAQVEAARADAERWRALHGELRALVADQL